MSHDDIQEFESETSRGKIKARFIQMENGLLVMITESEKYRLGVSAIAIPPGQGRSSPSSKSEFSVGVEDALVRSIAERLAAWTNQMCMLVLGMKEIDRALMMEIMSFLKMHLVS
jgi:hypothetical protein